MTLLAAAASAGVLGPWQDGRPEILEITPTAALADADPPACSEALSGGMQLPEHPDLYTRWDPSRSWGTRYLVEALLAASEEMSYLLPEADPILVGDISRRSGGPMYGHRSHRGGLDADIGLYMVDRRQPLGGFEDVPPWKLDVEANWLLIRALLDTGRVDFILLDASLIATMRRWLLDNAILEADEVDAIFPPAYTAGLWQMTGVVRHAAGHRNHMHVRVRCQ